MKLETRLPLNWLIGDFLGKKGRGVKKKAEEKFPFCWFQVFYQRKDGQMG